MSIVPPSGLLRLLYNEANRHDIEYKATAFWQAYLQSKFTLADGFAIVAEYAPNDESRKRSDYTVLQYVPGTGSATRIMVGEAKREGTHPKFAEADALATAKEVLHTDGGNSIVVLTTWACSFRLWTYRKQHTKLSPYDGGSDEVGHKKSYIDADYPGSSVLQSFITLQLERQGAAPDDSTLERTTGNSIEEEAGGPIDYFEDLARPLYETEDVDLVSSAPWPSAPIEYGDAEPEREQRAQTSREPVRVHLDTSFLHPNSYFHDHKGKNYKTARADWSEREGRYVHRSGKFYARHLPS